MTRKCLAAVTSVALVLMLAGVASAQDAKTVIADATKAMGYTGLNTIVYSGPMSHEGAATLGQWMGPTKGWHGNTVKNFTRFIDFNAGTSSRTGLQSRPGDSATGLLAGINLARLVAGEPPVIPPPTTMLGALYRYLHEADPRHFQPMNANFGLLDELDVAVRDKRRKRELMADRALRALDEWSAASGIAAAGVA